MVLIVKIANWQGRLGNNIYQISNAIKYAQINNGIYVNDLHHSIIKNFMIDFSNSTNSPKQYYSHEFFYDNRNNLTLGERRQICIQYIFDKLTIPIPNVLYNNTNTLYLQIRGEDAFKHVNGSPYYPQPPLCFYTFIINTFKFDNLRIITKDMKNPCTQKLLDLYAGRISVVFKSLQEDLSELLYAENVLFSSGGTFGKMIVLCSNNIKNAYTCYNSLDEISDPILVDFNHTNTITDFNIYNYLINNYIHYKEWNGTKKEQLDLMLSLDESNIQYIGINNT